MRVRLDWSGLAGIEKDILKLSKAETNQVKRQATRAAATVFRNEARKNAPEDKGVLKKNIVVAGVKGDTAAGVAVKGKAFYWQFSELGTSKQAAVPFIRPAYDVNQDKAAEAAIEKLIEGVDKVLMK